MAGERQLLLYWDPELDGAFRRRLEQAFGKLGLNAADAAAVDVDPDALPPVRIAFVSITGAAAHGSADMIVLAGPGDFASSGNSLRLETSDIDGDRRRWSAFIAQVSAKLGKPSLATPTEQVELRLDEAVRRAEACERALATMEPERNNAVRTAKQTEMQLASMRARVSELEAKSLKLANVDDSTAFSLASVPADLRDCVNQALDHAWRARLAAARAAEMAAVHTDALVWKTNIAYSGETMNGRPHGFGEMIFRKGSDEIARYAGAFEEGRRTGHGVATSDDGMIWTGAWKNDGAFGFGLLETPDGRRFEGEVAPDESGAPKQVRGWVWGQAPRAVETYRVAPPALPSPQAAGS